MLLANNYPNDRSAYLSVESVLRKHFGTVLSFEYDAAHQDHWHVDDGSPVGFRSGSESRVKYLQMTLAHVFDVEVPLTIDGKYGDKTREAARDVLKMLRLATAVQVSTNSKIDRLLRQVWPRFLDKAAARGLAALLPLESVTEESPAELLKDLHRVIKVELGETGARKWIEVAVTRLMTHPEIDDAFARAG